MNVHLNVQDSELAMRGHEYADQTLKQRTYTSMQLAIAQIAPVLCAGMLRKPMIKSSNVITHMPVV
jgi:hypothetical protein